jgi:hypothetical protein
MATAHQDLIQKAYAAFNDRDIDRVLSTFHPAVQWSKAWEGGYIVGHDEIRQYWTRQWKELNPTVEPTGFIERPNGSLEVAVYQKVKDLGGSILFDGIVKHIYTFEDGLIKSMDIEK